MAYDFQTSERDGILIARVKGGAETRFVDNFDEMWNFWSGVAQGMQQRGLHRLLAVILARGTLRSLDVPMFYRRLAEMGFRANMRLAVVAEIMDHDQPVMKLGVNGAQRDGWTIGLFSSETEATEWLLQG